MNYTFANLSPADFEDLARDLVGKELGLRFEAFAPGPDGGVDGRHAKGTENTVLQAKHYVGSSYTLLRTAVKKERHNIDILNPKRYLLVTSRRLTQRKKAELAHLLGPCLRQESDIFSADELNALLRTHPEIEQAHIKLWLASAAVLRRILNAPFYVRQSITQNEIAAKVRIYAPNPSFTAAQDILDAQHVLIISGPPGVGKTTLAEMLTYAHSAHGWEIVPIRTLEDAYVLLNDNSKAIYFFDDFLGKVALDRHALSHNDSDLARLIRRIRATPNARFLLTTRAYIFEEARQVSEHLADNRLDVSKYVLDVGIYTRKIKARILYNHLLAAEAPPAYVEALMASGNLVRIVDHKNYNPRIIEWMTDTHHVQSFPASEYPARFIEMLDHPSRLWDVAFRTHLSSASQHLLIALFFCSQYGVEIEELRLAFRHVHTGICDAFSRPRGPKDFEASMRTLEGSFTAITGATVNFVNPSLRDYLSEYIDDDTLLSVVAKSARQSDTMRNVWNYIGARERDASEVAKMASLLLTGAEELLQEPTQRRVPHGPSSYSIHFVGLSNTARIALLLELYKVTHNDRFGRIAIQLANNPVDGLDSWRDGDAAVEIINSIRSEEDILPLQLEVADNLEAALVEMLRYTSFEDLSRILDSIDLHSPSMGPTLLKAANAAVAREIDDMRNVVRDVDSESTLEDYLSSVNLLGPKVGVPVHRIAHAVRAIQDKIEELQDREERASSPNIKPRGESDEEAFDDAALNSLFQTLIAR